MNAIPWGMSPLEVLIPCSFYTLCFRLITYVTATVAANLIVNINADSCSSASWFGFGLELRAR